MSASLALRGTAGLALLVGVWLVRRRQERREEPLDPPREPLEAPGAGLDEGQLDHLAPISADVLVLSREYLLLADDRFLPPGWDARGDAPPGVWPDTRCIRWHVRVEAWRGTLGGSPGTPDGRSGAGAARPRALGDTAFVVRLLREGSAWWRRAELRPGRRYRLWLREDDLRRPRHYSLVAAREA